MAYNLVVLVREVWDTRDLINAPVDEGGAVKSDALDTRFEPEDLNALEMALRIKDENDATVTAIAIGAPGDVDVLRECMYRGVDKVLRIEADIDKLDTQARAELAAAAIKDMESFDVVLVGSTVADAENSQLGTHVASILGIDSVNWVDEIEGVSEASIKSKRAIEMGYETIETPFPALISVGVALLEDDPRSPRNAKAMLKLKKKKQPIESKNGDDLGFDDPSAKATTKIAAFEVVEQRVIESQEVDSEDESALQTMLNEVLKGE